MTTAPTNEIPWDGWVRPYVPPPAGELKIDPSLRLHTEVGELDPITHEVLRFALWNVNLEHGNTMLKISGSPIAAYGHDFNPAILDEHGDFVLFGPFLQYLSSATGSAVKWTLENRSANPGIRPGDVFIANDPWIASTHQPDVAVIAPVFVDDRLFCWVGNTLQQWDLGGTAPGGFNPMAPDAFWEPPCIPPLKIVEEGVIRRDIEELYTRFSRMPQLVALDLRAMLAPLRGAVEAIQKLCARYGAGTVKASMRKLQDDSERAFVKRLSTIPDGTWTAESFMESAQPGDRGVYKNRVTLTKEGDRLIFTNYGSADQIGAINATLPAWRGACVSYVLSLLLFDQMFVIEGALRHCEFRVDPGTINCATHPASVSGGTAGTLVTSIGLGGLVLSKMLASSTDEELRTEVQSCMGAMAFPIDAISGIDQRGNPYSSFLLDPLAAALAAGPWRDGQDTGGYPWDLQSTTPNVEENELFYPLLYLWRRERPDSGGAGKFRGGNGVEFAFIPHKTDRILISTVGSAMAVPGPGLFGGLPSSPNDYQRITGSGIREHLAAGGSMPTSLAELAELGAVSHPVPAKSFNNEVGSDDVWFTAVAAASGYGDPLLRDPARVEADVAEGRVSEEWARKAYGVVVGDADATRALRAERLRERLGCAPQRLPVPDPTGHGGHLIAESLELLDGGIACRNCGHRLSDTKENWKTGAIIRSAPLAEGNPWLPDPTIYTDTPVRVRHFICPGCAVQLDSEVAVGEQGPLWDLRVGITEVESARLI